MTDDHPNIIKMPDVPPVKRFGLGYEIFHGMKLNPNTIAQYVADTDESQTYAELLDLCTRVAINLKNENLLDDDIVGLCVENHKHSCAPYIASLFLGYKLVALDPGLTAEDKSKLLLKVTPRIMFVDAHLLQNMIDTLEIAKLDIKLVVIGENASGQTSFSQFLEAPGEEIDRFEPVIVEDIERTAIIFFGSGTTGVTKGICISHYGLLARTEGPTISVSTIFAQLNWISYTLLLIGTLRKGTTRVLVNNFEIDKLWQLIENYKISFIFASVFQVAAIAESEVPNDVDISAFRFLVTGGSVLPLAVVEKMNERFPNVITVQGYGLTEMGGPVFIFSIMNPEHRKWRKEKPTSCGAPMSGIWYKVVDVETEEILGPGKPGELRMKSKLGMVGYYNMDTSEGYDSEGWLKTGDIVKYDEDHCFYVVDRLKEMIKYRCWTISPSAIEDVLMSHPAVDIAAVIGIPHEEESDFPMGIVTLKKDCSASPEEIAEYVNQRVIDRQKLRAGVKIISEMPFTSTGKIIKRVLRRKVMNGEL
ncbi:hypothetical protein WA026_023322 [Henosepilachna vigintioctopunctata]|uniref:Uncharacterized protein n=1 Tax=Henosepilachna vigintioctopunctata TaxID=420089 RepID=A0AAW1UP78_9CUCU